MEKFLLEFIICWKNLHNDDFSLGEPKPMGRTNITWPTEFILLGLSRPEDQKPLFVMFLLIYLITVIGNLLAILTIHTQTLASRHPCTFSWSVLLVDILFLRLLIILHASKL